MPKPNDDIQEIKRRLLLLERLDGRAPSVSMGPQAAPNPSAQRAPSVSMGPRAAPNPSAQRALVCAEGTYLTGPVEVTDADAIVAACRAGRPSLAELRAGLAVSSQALLVTPAVLASAQRDLRVLESPRVASIVRSAGRIFRRHGDLDAPWIAAKQARIDALAGAAHRASLLDQGGGTFAPWLERVIEIVGVARGDQAEGHLRSLAFETAAEIAQGAAAKRGPRTAPVAPKNARGSGPRDDIERALTFLAHGSLWFDPTPRDHDKDRLREEGATPLFTPKDLAMEPPALRALALHYKGIPLRLHEVLAFSRIKLKSSDAALARLVAKGLPVEKVARMAKMDRATDLLSVSSGAEGAAAYAEWVSTLVPHYEKLGLDLPLTPELFDRMATSRKSDLAVLAVCLLKHHSKAEPDTAEQALARLDATLALFTRRPDDVASILGELTGTTPGAGRKAMPDIADWLEDDTLLDRYLHLSKIAGQPLSLSRTLRADFDRKQTLSGERDHLASLPSRTPVQEARLARLIEGDVAVPTPDRTRRRLRERIPELLARAYEARLDAALRRIAREAWGIHVPRLTPAWRDAIRFYLSIEDNRDLLATVLRTWSSGADLTRALPRNQAWITSVSSRFDVEAWLAPRSRDVDIGGDRHRLEIERDPVEVLRMGLPFDTCLSIEGGCNAASTVVNAADANKRVLYLRDEKGAIVARKLLAVSRDNTLLGYRLYIAKNEHAAEIREAFREMCERVSAEARLPFASRGKPKQIHPGFWYDDGAVTFESPKEEGDEAPVDVTDYCRSLGVPVPTEIPDGLRQEAHLFTLIRAERIHELTALLSRASTTFSTRAASEWLASRLTGERRIAEARQSFRLASALLGRAEKDGYPALFQLAAEIAGPEAGDGFTERVRAFPPTLEFCVALLEAAQTAGRSGRKVDHNGAEHETLDLLPELVRALPVASGFTLCDRATPFLRWFEKKVPDCAECVRQTERSVTAQMAKAYLLAPDPAAVLARLSGRASALSVRCAVAIAARFPLTPLDVSKPPERFHRPVRRCAPAARALLRLTRKGADSIDAAELFAALLRQTAGVPRGVTLPVPSSPPFETLGDLLAQLDITPLLTRWTTADIGMAEWRPDPWELYHLRRTDTPLRARVVREATAAALSPSSTFGLDAERAIQRLARLGDPALIKALLAAQTDPDAATRRRRALLERASALAREIEGQMRAADAPDPLSSEGSRRAEGRPKTNTDELDRCLFLHVCARIDRHLAEGASRETEPDDSLALAFQWLLESEHYLTTANEVIETLAFLRDGRFSPADRHLLHAWFRARADRGHHSLSEPLVLRLIGDLSLRPLALADVAGTGTSAALATYQTLESLAERSGKAHLLAGVFEALASALFERGDLDIHCFWPEPLYRRAVRVLLSRHPARALEAYRKLANHRAAALFLDELEQTPLFEDVPFRTQIRVWQRGAPNATPATLEWLLDRIAVGAQARSSRASRKSPAKKPSRS